MVVTCGLSDPVQKGSPSHAFEKERRTMRSTWPSLKDLSRSLQSSLDHLKEPVRRGGKFGTRMPSYFQSKPAWVHPRDRIPFWHVAPGDSVAVIRGEEGVRDKFGTVERVDRERNLVFLKEDIFRVHTLSLFGYSAHACMDI